MRFGPGCLPTVYCPFVLARPRFGFVGVLPCDTTLCNKLQVGTDCWIENFQTQPTNAFIGGFHIKKWTVEPVADPATNRTLWVVELKILAIALVFPPGHPSRAPPLGGL